MARRKRVFGFAIPHYIIDTDLEASLSKSLSDVVHREHERRSIRAQFGESGVEGILARNPAGRAVFGGRRHRTGSFDLDLSN